MQCDCNGLESFPCSELKTSLSLPQQFCRSRSGIPSARLHQRIQTFYSRDHVLELVRNISSLASVVWRENLNVCGRSLFSNLQLFTVVSVTAKHPMTRLTSICTISINGTTVSTQPRASFRERFHYLLIASNSDY